MVIVHILVLKKRIERGKIGSFDIQFCRGRKLLFGDNDCQDVFGCDRFAGGQEPPQCIIDKIKSFVLGGVQQLEILLDGGSFRRVLDQLIIGHAESRGGVHVVDILVIDKRAGLADERIDDVPKVDGFLVGTELSRHSLDAFVSVPKLKMILVNTDFEFQADILAADRVRVAFHANDTIGAHCQGNRRARTAPLRRHGGKHFEFLTESFLSRCVPPKGQLSHEGHVIINTEEVAASPQSQRLVERIFEVTMRRFNVAVFMRLTNVDAVAFDAVVVE
ncbi:MAG: hypothetical protein NZ808_02310 [Myxococcota bacterium]|nr:hypothetical protein [Myxococcota bacterium]